MIGQSAGVFAQTYHHHLEDAAFDGSMKAGVRFDSGNDADMIRLGCLPVHNDWETFGT